MRIVCPRKPADDPLCVWQCRVEIPAHDFLSGCQQQRSVSFARRDIFRYFNLDKCRRGVAACKIGRVRAGFQ